MENVENLILEQIRALRNDVQTFRQEARRDFETIKPSLNSLERSVAGVHDDLAIMSGRLDAVENDMNTIKRRIELTSRAKWKRGAMLPFSINHPEFMKKIHALYTLHGNCCS